MPGLEDIRDIKPPLDLPLNPFVLIGGVLLLLLVLGFLYFKLLPLLRHRFVAKIPNPKTPKQIALEELNRLQQEGLLLKQSFKEYYARLSNIIRQYIENQFKIHAPEMTTEEFLVKLQHLPTSPVALAPSLESNTSNITRLSLNTQGSMITSTPPQLTQGHKLLLTEFLNACDLVKFAKYAPTGEEASEGFLKAQKFIEET